MDIVDIVDLMDLVDSEDCLLRPDRPLCPPLINSNQRYRVVCYASRRYTHFFTLAAESCRFKYRVSSIEYRVSSIEYNKKGGPKAALYC